MTESAGKVNGEWFTNGCGKVSAIALIRADNPDHRFERRGWRIDCEGLQAAERAAVEGFLRRDRLAEPKEAIDSRRIAQDRGEGELDIDAFAGQRLAMGADQQRATVAQGDVEAGGDEAAVAFIPDRQEIVVGQLAPEETLQRIAGAAEREIAFANMVKDEQVRHQRRIIIRGGSLRGHLAFEEPFPGVEDDLGVWMKLHRNHLTLPRGVDWIPPSPAAFLQPPGHGARLGNRGPEQVSFPPAARYGQAARYPATGKGPDLAPPRARPDGEFT